MFRLAANEKPVVSSFDSQSIEAARVRDRHDGKESAAATTPTAANGRPRPNYARLPRGASLNVDSLLPAKEGVFTADFENENGTTVEVYDGGNAVLDCRVYLRHDKTVSSTLLLRLPSTIYHTVLRVSL